VTKRNKARKGTLRELNKKVVLKRVTIIRDRKRKHYCKNVLHMSTLGIRGKEGIKSMMYER
jgi:hypothetical protein